MTIFLVASRLCREEARENIRATTLGQTRKCAQLFTRKPDLFTAKYVHRLASILLKHRGIPLITSTAAGPPSLGIRFNEDIAAHCVCWAVDSRSRFSLSLSLSLCLYLCLFLFLSTRKDGSAKCEFLCTLMRDAEMKLDSLEPCLDAFVIRKGMKGERERERERERDSRGKI